MDSTSYSNPKQYETQVAQLQTNVSSKKSNPRQNSNHIKKMLGNKEKDGYM